MADVLKTIGEIGIVPVIKIDDAKDAVNLAKALVAGDVPVAEVTFRTAAAEESIKKISKEVPDILVGAGTVLTVDQAKKAMDAGAKFLVSPGFNPKVVEFCVKQNMPITPGVNNPSTIEQALEYGLKVLKFFPCEQSGGLPMMKALAGPYGDISFIPTGGINKDNAASFLAYNKIVAVGGSWMAPNDLIAAGKFDEITKLCADSITAINGFEFVHVGINCKNETEARATVDFLSKFFKFAPKEGNSSIFAGKGFEVMKSPYLGEKGHLAIAVNSVERAVALFKRKGIGIKEDSVKMDGSVMKAAYLDMELSGFAVHFVRK